MSGRWRQAHEKSELHPLNRNEQQFESLVRSFHQPLFRYAFWLTRNQALAEDLLQETFTRAWKSLSQLKDPGSARPWLYTILTRENARRFERKQLPVTELGKDNQLELVADPNDSLEVMSIRRAIMQLPENFRQPLALQVIGGLSTDEIATVLTLNTNTVSTRLFRARAELKKRLSPANTGADHYG